jgi:hypothetical protein
LKGSPTKFSQKTTPCKYSVLATGTPKKKIKKKKKKKKKKQKILLLFFNKNSNYPFKNNPKAGN